MRRDRSCQASSLCIWVRGGSSTLRLRIGLPDRTKLINKIILPNYYEFKIMVALPTHSHIRRKSVQKWQMQKFCKCACRNFGKEWATRKEERHTRRTKGGRWTNASDLSASADLMQLDHANFSVLCSRLPVTCRMVEETWSGVLPCRHRARMFCALYPTRPRIRAVHRHCYYGRLPQSGASKQLRK